MFSDVRHAFRQFAQAPAFTAVAILTIALGIGACTIIFSAIDSMLLHPLRFDEPERMVQIWETVPDGNRNSVSGGAFTDWRTHSEVFTDLAIANWVSFNLTGNGTPERITGLEVSASYLRVLRVAPLLGRDFAPDDDEVSPRNRPLLLSHGSWQNQFGADPTIVGRPLILDQQTYTVIGVLPPNALLANQASFLVPLVLQASEWQRGRDNHWASVYGRLKPGISGQQAETELRGIKQRLTADYPAYKKDWSVAVASLQESVAGNTRPWLIMLMGMVTLVLLIACTNVANLLLARGAGRHKDMAIRAALGAGSARIIRLVLTESVLLALGGGVLGVLIAAFGLEALNRMAVDVLSPMMRPEIDGRALAFSILLACGSGIAFGLLPARRACRTDLNRDLKESGRGSSSGGRARTQSVLVVSEVALTVALLVGTGLFLRSFLRVVDADPGFNPHHALVFDLSIPGAKYPAAENRTDLVNRMLARLQAVAGVTSAGATTTLPLGGSSMGNYISREDRPDTRFDFSTGNDYVAGDYFTAIGTPLLQGRVLTATDNAATAPRVLVVSKALAERFFPEENPLGQQMNFQGHPWEIVGVVADVRHGALDSEGRPRVYGALAHSPWSTSIVLRTAVPPATLVETVRQAVLSVDSDQPIANVRTLEQAVDQALLGRRITVILLGAFGIGAVGLAAMGIFGVMTYTISQRVRELSIRMALGAQRRDVIHLILRDGLKLTLTGLAIGLGLALGGARLMGGLLYEVAPDDPLVFIVATGFLALVALLSVYVPARRAARADPLTALRAE